jgi:ArsR family transcriptional regulator
LRVVEYAYTAELFELVAQRFKVLAEPARLAILNALREGEQSVSELMEATGLSQANLSKHLQLLHRSGFLDRRRDGVYIYYRLAGEDIFRLCDIMCERLTSEAAARRQLFAQPARAAASRARKRKRRASG